MGMIVTMLVSHKIITRHLTNGAVLLADTLTACERLLSLGKELHRSTAGVAIAGDSEGGATDVRRGTGHDGTSGVLNDAQELLTFLRTDDRPAHFAVVYLHWPSKPISSIEGSHFFWFLHRPPSKRRGEEIFLAHVSVFIFHC